VIFLDALPAPLMTAFYFVLAFPVVGTSMLIANYIRNAKKKRTRRNRRAS
jgi:hypothetical protein